MKHLKHTAQITLLLLASSSLAQATVNPHPQANQATYTYDEAGNKLSQTDAIDNTTTWTYGALGRVFSRSLPLGQTESFLYDVAGNLNRQVDFNNQATTYAYDNNNRLSLSTYADGQTEQHSYDAIGNRIQTRLTDANGAHTVSYQYDSQYRLSSETQADGSLLSYQYDSQGNRTQLKTTQGANLNTIDYAYDALDRLSTVTDANGTTTYGYDNVGNRSHTTHANGNQESYTYDALNRLTELTTKNSASSLLASYTYTLDTSGKRTNILEATGRNTAYVYDTLNRLSSETLTDAVNGNYSASYSYDKVGNRTEQTIDGVQTQYSYDNNNRLSQQGGTTYTYDNNGSMLSETLDGNTTQYQYNAKNQLNQLTAAGQLTHYQYNIDGIRIQQSTGATVTDYLVDSNRPYAQVIQQRDNDIETVRYTYGDDLLSQTRGGITSSYHYDGLGSTRSLSDSTGLITDSYHYDAYGKLLSQTGTTENDYLFTGEQRDSTLGQYYLRARYYDQGIGRFTQQDTWMGNSRDPVTLHKYAYGNVDPVNVIDPSGRFGLSRISITLAVWTTAELTSGILFAGGDLTMTNGHFYESVSDLICIGGPNCTKEAIFELLREYPAPSPYLPMSPPADDGKKIFAQWPSIIPIGNVIHTQFPAQGKIVNTTVAWQHFMHNGTITRTIEKSGLGYRIRTIGEGVNISPLFAYLNKKGGAMSFKGLDEKTISAYRGKYGE